MVGAWQGYGQQEQHLWLHKLLEWRGEGLLSYCVQLLWYFYCCCVLGSWYCIRIQTVLVPTVANKTCFSLKLSTAKGNNYGGDSLSSPVLLPLAIGSVSARCSVRTQLQFCGELLFFPLFFSFSRAERYLVEKNMRWVCQKREFAVRSV